MTTSIQGQVSEGIMQVGLGVIDPLMQIPVPRGYSGCHGQEIRINARKTEGALEQRTGAQQENW